MLKLAERYEGWFGSLEGKLSSPRNFLKSALIAEISLVEKGVVGFAMGEVACPEPAEGVVAEGEGPEPADEEEEAEGEGVGVADR